MPENELPVAQLTYEQALAELEEIVSLLENAPPALEESARLYERGRALAQHCAGLLESVEIRLRTLGEAATGDPA
jgi:exodeoxyribonuclease VII small subunit